MPVVADRQRANNQVLSTYWAFFDEVGQIGDGLDSFSKTHVISKDSIHFLEGELDHPDQSFLLVFLELASFEGFGLSFSEGILKVF